MSARSFRSVFMVASCAGAALGCYLVSLRVASERSQLESVETKIVLAQRNLRVLQTEIGTRGRLAQLERWNVKVLALSAPAAQQFVNGGYELAKLTRTQPKVDFEGPVVLASAPAPQRSPTQIGQESRDDSGATTATAPTQESVGPRALLHIASLKTETREVPAQAAAVVRPPAAKKSMEKPVAAAKPVPKKSVDKPDLAAAKPVTKTPRLARNDPLAPLPGKLAKKTAKDTGSAR
ncbi:hypothetical protein ACUXST_001574 [Sphingomonas sp. F9_3S_D5_B_2]